MRVPVLQGPFQHLVSFIFLMLTILIGVYRYLVVGLICISLMTNYVKHIFMGLTAIHVSSLPKCLFKPFADLKENGLFTFLLSFECSFCILDTKPDICLKCISSQSVACLFIS